MERSTGSWGTAVVDGPVISVEVSSTEAQMTAVVGGLVTYDGRVAGLDGYPAVWPNGTVWDTENRSLRLASGETVRPGRRVRGGGGYISTDAVRTLFGDAAAEACGEADEIPVFNPGQPIVVG